MASLRYPALAAVRRETIPMPGQRSVVSPLSYQSKSRPTPSFGYATNLSSDMVTKPITLAALGPTEYDHAFPVVGQPSPQAEKARAEIQ